VSRPAAIVDGTVTQMSNVSSFINAATNGMAIVNESDAPPTLSLPGALAAQPESLGHSDSRRLTWVVVS
jgi:hypothetical protein